MPRKEMSREELFALVWEKPTSEIAQDLGISDVAVGKLCAKLQVPKPPRGYWARVEGGQKPRRPALAAFREEIDVKRKELVRVYAAEFLSKLQRQFFEAALVELKARGVDVGSAETNPGRPLLHLDSNLAAQILLVIQGKAQSWVEDGRVAAGWGPPARKSLGRLVERLLPLAREQLLVFETEGRRKSYTADGPAILLRLTGELQKRIAGLSNLVRDQSLQHVVMPLMSVDHAWSTHQLYSPESHMVLESWLCVSAREIWVEWLRKSWRDDEPPERHTTNKITSRAIMPIDFLPVEVKALPPVIAETSIKPYAERLRALQAAEGVFEMVSGAAYAMQREVPAETLSIVERLWFGQERPFQAAREAFQQVETELERWERELEAERSRLAQSILGVVPGDIVTSAYRGKLQRLSVTNVYLYSSGTNVSFSISGIRFRKDGTLGKIHDSFSLSFEDSEERTT